MKIRTIAIAALALVVAWLRWHHCNLLPINTGDIARQIRSGEAVLQFGLSSMQFPLDKLMPSTDHVAWSNLPYNYPPLALMFFVAMAWLEVPLRGIKVVLTLIEAVNSVAIAKFTGSRVLGLVYWAMPMSIWWVSREGQIEPIQILLTIAALFLLRRESYLAAWLVLMLAIEAKLTAAILVPYFLVRSWGSLRPAAAGAVLGLIPLAAMQTQYDVVRQGMFYGFSMLSGAVPQRYSPYWFNPFDSAYWSIGTGEAIEPGSSKGRETWHPSWLIVWLHIVTPLATAWFLRLAYRCRSIDPLPAALFLVALALSTQTQFWYILLLPSFMLPISNRRMFAVGLVLVVLLDPYSLTQLLWGPWGYTLPGYYRLNGFR